MRALVIVVVLFVVAVPSAGAWTWPVVGPVLSAFFFDPAHPYAAGEHRGIDIGSPSGTAVAAPAGGEVTFAGSDNAEALAVVAELVAAGVPRKRAAELVSSLTGVPRNTLYRGSL